MEGHELGSKRNPSVASAEIGSRYHGGTRKMSVHRARMLLVDEKRRFAVVVKKTSGKGLGVRPLSGLCGGW